MLTMSKPAEILVIEDNLGDIELIRLAMESSKILNTLHSVRDGKDGLDFLYRRGDHQDAPVPDLILLDWNLPLVNGAEVLKQIKKDEQLNSIPIIILTTSSNEADIQTAYRLGANCYITKPIDVDEFLAAVKSINDFWVSIVKLPSYIKD